MSFNESENIEKQTQSEVSELYQNSRKPQAPAEQPKQAKSAIAKSSATEQLNDAVEKTQAKAKSNAITNTKAVIAAGQNSGKEKAALFAQAEQLAFLNQLADAEIQSAKALLVGIPEYRQSVNEASGNEIESLLDFDEDLSIESLQQQLDEAVGKSKKQLAMKSFFGE
ncbi:MAG TPA: hypothetical protein V6D21_22380 [Candidatus Obscuribacterales bacterium]